MSLSAQISSYQGISQGDEGPSSQPYFRLQPLSAVRKVRASAYEMGDRRVTTAHPVAEAKPAQYFRIDLTALQIAFRTPASREHRPSPDGCHLHWKEGQGTLGSCAGKCL